MASAHELARGHKRLRALIEFALGEGWRGAHAGGHLKFTKRLRADLHQLDGERPPRRAQRPRAASPRRPAGAGERPWLS
jgi:hypothetical protein